MDTIETIILTSVINFVLTILVGGIVIYAIQKKIDATIQKSLFEHEVKFSRAYPKTLEVLETMHQKLREFTDDVVAWVDDTDFFLEKGGEITAKAHMQRQLDAKKKLDEYHRYFEANRLFLSDGLIRKLSFLFDMSRKSFRRIFLALDYETLPSSYEAWHNVRNGIENQIDILSVVPFLLEDLYKAAADMGQPDRENKNSSPD